MARVRAFAIHPFLLNPALSAIDATAADLYPTQYSYLNDGTVYKRYADNDKAYAPLHGPVAPPLVLPPLPGPPPPPLPVIVPLVLAPPPPPAAPGLAAAPPAPAPAPAPLPPPPAGGPPAPAAAVAPAKKRVSRFAALFAGIAPAPAAAPSPQPQPKRVSRFAGLFGPAAAPPSQPAPASAAAAQPQPQPASASLAQPPTQPQAATPSPAPKRASRFAALFSPSGSASVPSTPINLPAGPLPLLNVVVPSASQGLPSSVINLPVSPGEQQRELKTQLANEQKRVRDQLAEVKQLVGASGSGSGPPPAVNRLDAAELALVAGSVAEAKSHPVVPPADEKSPRQLHQGLQRLRRMSTQLERGIVETKREIEQNRLPPESKRREEKKGTRRRYASRALAATALVGAAAIGYQDPDLALWLLRTASNGVLGVGEAALNALSSIDPEDVWDAVQLSVQFAGNNAPAVLEAAVPVASSVAGAAPQAIQVALAGGALVAGASTAFPVVATAGTGIAAAGSLAAAAAALSATTAAVPQVEVPPVSLPELPPQPHSSAAVNPFEHFQPQQPEGKDEKVEASPAAAAPRHFDEYDEPEEYEGRHEPVQPYLEPAEPAPVIAQSPVPEAPRTETQPPSSAPSKAEEQKPAEYKVPQREVRNIRNRLRTAEEQRLVREARASGLTEAQIANIRVPEDVLDRLVQEEIERIQRQYAAAATKGAAAAAEPNRPEDHVLGGHLTMNIVRAFASPETVRQWEDWFDEADEHPVLQFLSRGGAAGGGSGGSIGR